jgi:hypothetical protein
LIEAEVRSFIRFQTFILYFVLLFVVYVSEFSEHGAFVIIQRVLPFFFTKEQWANNAITNLIGWIWITKTFFAWMLGCWHFGLGLGAYTSFVIEKGEWGIHIHLDDPKTGTPKNRLASIEGF